MAAVFLRGSTEVRNLVKYPITREECVRALREAAVLHGEPRPGDVSPLCIGLVADMLERRMEGAGLDDWIADHMP